MYSRPVSLPVAAACLAAALLTTPGHAAEAEWRSWPLGERAGLAVSAWRPDIDSFVSLTDTDNAIQGSIDFERDLGLDDSKTSLLVDAYWRVSKRNSLRFDYFNLDRSAVSASEVEITIRPDGQPPVTFPVGTELQAALDFEVYELAWAYSPVFNERVDWSLGLGLSWQDITLGITNPLDTAERAETEVSAPLPTLNTRLSWALSEKWLLDLGLGWLDVDFDLEDSGRFEGRIISLEAGLRWQVFDNAGLVLAWRSFDVDVDAEDDDFTGQVEYDYRGPALGINVNF